MKMSLSTGGAPPQQIIQPRTQPKLNVPPPLPPLRAPASPPVTPPQPSPAAVQVASNQILSTGYQVTLPTASGNTPVYAVTINGKLVYFDSKSDAQSYVRSLVSGTPGSYYPVASASGKTSLFFGSQPLAESYQAGVLTGEIKPEIEAGQMTYALTLGSTKYNFQNPTDPRTLISDIVGGQTAQIYSAGGLSFLSPSAASTYSSTQLSGIEKAIQNLGSTPSASQIQSILGVTSATTTSSGELVQTPYGTITLGQPSSYGSLSFGLSHEETIVNAQNTLTLNNIVASINKLPNPTYAQISQIQGVTSVAPIGKLGGLLVTTPYGTITIPHPGAGATASKSTSPTIESDFLSLISPVTKALGPALGDLETGLGYIGIPFYSIGTSVRTGKLQLAVPPPSGAQQIGTLGLEAAGITASILAPEIAPESLSPILTGLGISTRNLAIGSAIYVGANELISKVTTYSVTVNGVPVKSFSSPSDANNYANALANNPANANKTISISSGFSAGFGGSWITDPRQLLNLAATGVGYSYAFAPIGAGVKYVASTIGSVGGLAGIASPITARYVTGLASAGLMTASSADFNALVATITGGNVAQAAEVGAAFGLGSELVHYLPLKSIAFAFQKSPTALSTDFAAQEAADYTSATGVPYTSEGGKVIDPSGNVVIDLTNQIGGYSGRVLSVSAFGKQADLLTYLSTPEGRSLSLGTADTNPRILTGYDVPEGTINQNIGEFLSTKADVRLVAKALGTQPEMLGFDVQGGSVSQAVAMSSAARNVLLETPPEFKVAVQDLSPEAAENIENILTGKAWRGNVDVYGSAGFAAWVQPEKFSPELASWLTNLTGSTHLAGGDIDVITRALGIKSQLEANVAFGDVPSQPVIDKITDTIFGKTSQFSRVLGSAFFPESYTPEALAEGVGLPIRGLTLYHGTNADFASQILSEGFEPGSYLASDPTIAQEFALRKALQAGGLPTLLSVKVPPLDALTDLGPTLYTRTGYFANSSDFETRLWGSEAESEIVGRATPTTMESLAALQVHYEGEPTAEGNVSPPAGGSPMGLGPSIFGTIEGVSVMQPGDYVTRMFSSSVGLREFTPASLSEQLADLARTEPKIYNALTNTGRVDFLTGNAELAAETGNPYYDTSSAAYRSFSDIKSSDPLKSLIGYRILAEQGYRSFFGVKLSSGLDIDDITQMAYYDTAKGLLSPEEYAAVTTMPTVELAKAITPQDFANFIEKVNSPIVSVGDSVRDSPLPNIIYTQNVTASSYDKYTSPTSPLVSPPPSVSPKSTSSRSTSPTSATSTVFSPLSSLYDSSMIDNSPVYSSLTRPSPTPSPSSTTGQSPSSYLSLISSIVDTSIVSAPLSVSSMSSVYDSFFSPTSPPSVLPLSPYAYQSERKRKLKPTLYEKSEKSHGINYDIFNLFGTFDEESVKRKSGGRLRLANPLLELYYGRSNAERIAGYGSSKKASKKSSKSLVDRLLADYDLR